MARIVVPDLAHPTLCFRPNLTLPHLLTRCVFVKGHAGPHSWQLRDREALERAIDAARRDAARSPMLRQLLELRDRVREDS